MRIRMLEQRRFPQHTAPLELFEDQRIRVLDEPSTHDRHLRRKLSSQIHRLKKSESVTDPRGIIVGAEGWGHVHHSRPFFRRHEFLADDHFMLSLAELYPVEGTLIALA